MSWLIYGDSTAPPHKCELPKVEHLGDIWQCDECLKTFRAEPSEAYGFAEWHLIAFRDALKDVAMLHKRKNGQ